MIDCPGSGVCSPIASLPAQAQTATIYGSHGTFDVVNDTGRDAHGFEIQFEGLSEADAYDSFGVSLKASPLHPFRRGSLPRARARAAPGQPRPDLHLHTPEPILPPGAEVRRTVGCE
jgi:hypothetical protein